MTNSENLTKFTNLFSEEIWRTTYRDNSNTEEKNIDDTLRRVATAAASVERNEKLRKEYSEKFFDLLCEFKSTPGGRILANAGTKYHGTTLMNCFTGPKPKYDPDSLDGIFDVLRWQAQTLKSEGGWGTNFSFIRPRGSFISGVGVESPGSVKYMEIFDKSSDIITAGSGKKAEKKEAKGKIRKGAMMGIENIWHPDIEEFITAKQTPHRLEKFNMSVNCTTEFMDKVLEVKKLQAAGKSIPVELDKWELIFPDTSHPKYKSEWDGDIKEWKRKGYPVKIWKTVSAVGLWEKIMQSTYNRNEPGVMFMDNANRTHCWNYGGREATIDSSNPCGEQTMPPGSACDLGSLNLTQFILDNYKGFDLQKLQKHTKLAVRFLDNINDLSKTPLKQYDEAILKRRRIGIGILGWGSALYLLGVRFGSKEASKIKQEMMRTICYSAIEESIDLAEEKGMFEGCIPEKHAEIEFFNQIDLPKELRNRIRKVGIRNSALFSIQPTGSTGVLANIVSGGLEPVIAHEYIRTVIVPHCPDELLPVCPKYWESEFVETEMFKFTKEGDDQILRGVAKDGTVYKIDKNRGLTKEVLCEDYAVHMLKKMNKWNPKADWAVTINELSVDEHVTELKEFCRWLDSAASKTVNLPKEYPYEKFENLYLDAYKTGYIKGLTTYREGTMMNVIADAKSSDKTSGIFIITKNKHTKRPRDVRGELHLFTVGKHDYYTAVGFDEAGAVFEVFTGFNEGKKDEIISQENKGIIRKLKRGDYVFIGDDKEKFCLTNGHSDDSADALTRMISWGLRNGGGIEHAVHQLEKTKGSMLSFSKVLARTLKKYIKDNTVVAGEECPECNGKLIRIEGCTTCMKCSWSKCG